MDYPITLFKVGGVKLSVFDTRNYMVSLIDEPATLHPSLLEALEQLVETLTRLKIITDVPFDELLILMEQSREMMYKRLVDAIREGVIDTEAIMELENKCIKKLKDVKD